MLYLTSSHLPYVHLTGEYITSCHSNTYVYHHSETTDSTLFDKVLELVAGECCHW